MHFLHSLVALLIFGLVQELSASAIHQQQPTSMSSSSRQGNDELRLSRCSLDESGPGLHQPVQEKVAAEPCKARQKLLSAIIKQKMAIIAQSIYLPSVLARIIADYVPDMGYTWALVIDEVDTKYRSREKVSTSSIPVMQDFQLLEITEHGSLEVTELSTTPNVHWFDDIGTHCLRHDYHQLRECIRKKMNNETVNFQEDDLAWGRSTSKARYGTSYHTMDVLGHLLRHFRLQFVHRDSELYQRAINESVLLLGSNTTWIDIGKNMGMINQQLESCETMPNDDDGFGHWAIPYMKAYKESSIPRFLKKTRLTGDMVPLLYRINSSYDATTKKRKRVDESVPKI